MQASVRVGRMILELDQAHTIKKIQDDEWWHNYQIKNNEDSEAFFVEG